MKRLKHRNIIVIHGTVISDVSLTEEGAILVVNTDEEVRGLKRYLSDHKVIVPKQYIAEVTKTQRLDTVMIEGYIAPDRVIVCRDFFNVSAAFEHRQVSFLRNKNHLTVHGVVSSRVKPVRSGYMFFVTTETEVKTEHEIFANEAMGQSILMVQENDYVLIEGPYSKDKKLIVSSFNNVSMAFNFPEERNSGGHA
ncbi:MAG TPA: hypothetical protein DCP92_02720 [Nitrospiraceae bacterium]|jgi:hypothetical protein|nr:hypothetical protein [Nitrospiraceae bacterium]